MTESQYRCQLMGFARRLEVTYNQLFADLDLPTRQSWILEDTSIMRQMLEDGMHESRAVRIVMEPRLQQMKELNQ